MKKSIITVLSVGTILTVLMIFMACDQINHEANKIDSLMKRVSYLEEQARNWEAANTRLQNEKAAAIEQYNMLVDVNKVLIKERDMYKEENAELRGHVTSLNGIIENKTPEVKKFTIKFANGQLYNKAASRAVAKTVASIVKKYPVSRITVKGYSSHNGPAKLNMKLSKDRLEGVVDKIYEAYNNGPLHINKVAFGEGSDDERKVVVIVESIE